ncbi:hypothetical protein F0562_006578 [Nyssa sinensis]|uniref:Pre-nudix hydrolase domain-containing protein n=1 Tax=Nyssa sinensis TaxID=561372 RepID=A0A5J5AKY4_9ASTE|nr:hypothetical protein F0562_006578 [Nyssa sinensis]
MARNEEKAQSMLNRFITMKAEEKKKPKERRPYLASECRDLAEADKWRQQIMREIGRKVAEIQNEGLGEHRLRDLNDEINKLIREKGHWERRIIELGGPNYTKHSAKMTDLEGNIVDVPNPSGRGPGYRYFGAAKKLPGVRELFEKPPELRKRRTRYDIYKRIDASYYGYRDDEDGILEKLEGPAEEKMRAAAVAEWMVMEEIKREAKRAVKSGEVAMVSAAAAKILFEEEEDVVEEERKAKEMEENEKEKEFVVHVPLPDEKEIERMVVEKKKTELLTVGEKKFREASKKGILIPLYTCIFSDQLVLVLAYRCLGKNGVWIKLPIELVNLVEAAIKEGFWYHHVKPTYLMLVYWIPKTTNTLLANASHRVGIGAFVMNSNGEVALDVKEVLDTFRIAAQLGSDSLGAFVISMASNASDVLAVELLQKDACLALAGELGRPCPGGT